jgi:two-component system CheB/CheR fusion protein
MPKEDTASRKGAALRERAEQKLKQRKSSSPPRRDEDLQRLVHELEVHQVELEIQNEELRATRLDAETMAARYAELYEFAPMGYATLAPDSTISAINLAGARLFELERMNLVGRRLDWFVSPEDRTAFNDLLRDTLQRDDEEKSYREIVLTDGKKRFFARLGATALRRSHPEILVAIEDVSERKQRERELEEALRVVNASQRAARIGTFVIDVQTGRWTSSLVLDELFGIDGHFRRTAEGWRALVHPEDRDEMKTHLKSAMRGEERLDWEYRVVQRSTGEVRHVAIVGEIERDGVDPVRLVGTIQDVTERQRLLQERAELFRLAQEARARAEEANRAKDAFLATLSHELRNPLAPISNSLFVLEQSPPGSEQSKRARDVIHRQVSHMVRLVDDLLDITRITSGKIHLQRRLVDLNDLARYTVEDHRSLFDRNGVRLELATAAPPVVVDGDWDRLAQVVGNLLQNAAKFSRRGGTTRVTVSEARGEETGAIRVADNGIGMAPEMLARLFQPFMQAETTLDRSKGGLGLGMALSKGLVELHGGRIAAESEGLGKGSEFEVRLPLAKLMSAGSGNAPPGAPRAPRRVLIIDDNVDSAESLRELLELHRHQVQVAYNGPEGIAKARELRPEIVICDIGLPGMDGCEVARAIRADHELKSVYLIALSGYAHPDDVRRVEESGFQRHVAKPADPDQLERIFSEAVPPLA